VASNAKRVELRRELSQKATDELRAKVTETKSASARGDADRATKLARELAETRRQLKDERAELQVLRSKLVETQEGRTWAEEALSAAKHPAAPPQIARAHAELEEQLRAARSEVCDLRQEVVEKVNLLVSVSLQLSEALEAATTAERRTAEVEEQLVPQREIEALLRDSEKRREELAAALEEKTLETELLRQQLGQLESRTASRCGGGSAGTSDSFATTNPRASETATTEKAALTEELSGLSPQFFEEIEDLKYAYAVVRTSLGRYERAYGPLPASGEEP
jgi:chromosome segregation ATPase